MSASIVLARADLNRGVLPVVGAADAIGFNDTFGIAGAGVGFSLPPPAEVRDVARVEDKVIKRNSQVVISINWFISHHWRW